MANTFTLISSVTVGSGGTSSIDFTSIPATYTDLNLVISARTNRASDSDYLEMTFNGSTSGVTGKILTGSGSSAISGTQASSTFIDVNRTNANTSTASTFSNISVYIPNYTSGNNKSVSYDGVNENNATEAYTWMGAYVCSNSVAITSIKLEPGIGTSINQYSTAYLYGISNA
jgi:hypothetical protein